MFHTGVYLYIAGPAADVMGKNMKRGEKKGENEGKKRKDKGNVEGKRVKEFANEAKKRGVKRVHEK